MKTQYKVALVTFGVFMTEAMIHYNFGAHKHTKTKKIEFPKGKDLVKIAGVVAAFSILNGYIVSAIKNGQ